MADVLIELSTADKDRLWEVLEREEARLSNLKEEYRLARKPQNSTIRVMADEGAANMQSRIEGIRQLKAKLGPRTGTASKP